MARSGGLMTILAWAAGIALVLLMLAGLAQLAGNKEFSDEAYERECRRPSLLRTGLQEFQGFLEPEKKAAIEIVKEEKRKTDQSVPGEPPELS
jgi:hypothetical protein